MKFTCFVDINAPRDSVVQIFTNPDNLKDWQDGFIKMEQISGDPGTVGSTSNFYYKAGGRDMLIRETILENNLPINLKGLYEHKHMVNTMNNVFTTLDENTCCYVAEVEYTKLNGLIPKLMAFLMPGMFKKQVQKWLNQFKELAENQ